MPTGARRPFSEVVECAQTELVREAGTNVRGKYKGFVNQAYCNDMSTQLPEVYIKKKGFLTTMAAYSTGTVTVASGSTTILGSSTSWTSALSDSFINVSGYNRLPRITFTNATVLTINNSLTWTESSGAAKTYTLMQDRYALASDFSFMVKDNPEYPNVVSYQVNGYEVYLFPDTNESYDRSLVPTTSSFFSKYTVKYDGATPYLHIFPFPLNVDIVSYWYVPVLTAMTEYTTGAVTFTTGTAVVASNSLWTSINTANTYYIRNDADGTGSSSLWFKISTFVNDTALTLTSSFTGTSGTGITYTISEISKWPERFDDAMLFKTAMLVDPDNVQGPKWEKMYMEATGLDKGVESKRKRDSKVKSFYGMRG